MAKEKKVKKESKIKKRIEWFKESWKEPRKRAFLKLGLYGIFFVVMFLLIIIIGSVSQLFSDENEQLNSCIGTFCDIKNNNYEYRLTINSYDNEDYISYIELNGYKYGNDNYYKKTTNEDTHYFKYVNNVVYKKVNKEWKVAEDENIYTNNDYIFLEASNLEKLINNATTTDSFTSFDGFEKHDAYNMTMSDVSEFLSTVFQHNDITEIAEDSLNDVKIVVTYKNDIVSSVNIDFKVINGKNYYIEYRNIDEVTRSLINENFK